MVTETATIHTMPEEVSITFLFPSFEIFQVHLGYFQNWGFITHFEQVLAIILKMLSPSEKWLAMSVCKRWVKICKRWVKICKRRDERISDLTLVQLLSNRQREAVFNQNQNKVTDPTS